MQKSILLLTILCLPILLFAHGAHGSGMMAGFIHPILGVDHNIVLIATGILGYLLDQERWYLFPIAFITAMIVGGLLGIGNEATVLIEKVIAFSVFSIGFIIAFRLNPGLVVSLTVIALFGFVHGYAHGAEMPENNTALKYIPGYTLGAILLSFIGMYIGHSLYTNVEAKNYISVVGGIITGCGIMMLLP